MTNVIETLLHRWLHILRQYASDWVWGKMVCYVTQHRYCKVIELPVCCGGNPDNKMSGEFVHQIQFPQTSQCCPEAHASDKQVCKKSSGKAEQRISSLKSDLLS